jgi:hypothetical protein
MLFSFVPLIATLVSSPPVRDTTITVQGLIAAGQDSSGGATAGVILAEPIVINRQQVWVLDLAGTPGNWDDWDGRYVEATGTLGPKTANGWSINSVRLHDVKPQGAASREVTSPSHRSEVTVAVVPRRFIASPTVAAEPISPMIYFEVLVQGQTNLVFEASNNELVCVSVKAPDEGEPGWRDSWRLAGEGGTPMAIRIGPVLRVRIPIPGHVVARPGVYTVQATLCGNPDFNVKTALTVGQP